MAEPAPKKKVKAGSFQSLNLCSEVFRAILKLGYKQPTPIQRKTIPPILQGNDVVAMARTGSGKTAAFLIPILNKMKVEHSPVVGVRALVLSPTRELALQTAKFCRSINAYGSLRICILVGGQGMETQFAHLANNPDIIIATPGRLMHHILEAELSLQRVETLVFDEADRLFELGFQEQLQKILETTSPTRQCLLFSATLPSQLVGFSRLGMREPVFIRLDVETTLSDNLSLQYVYARREERDASALMLARRFVRPETSTIMFVATRHHVEFYGMLFRHAGVYGVCMVYGSMDQTARESEIYNFRKKKGILVTTDLAARGIDIPLLDTVVNFHFPPSSKLFVHRAGRTARAGKEGTCVSVVTADDLPYCLDLLLFLGRKMHFPNDGTTDGVLGAMPPLDDELETTKRLFASNDPSNDLPTLQKSKTAAYKEYFKTRPSASKQAVRRAKEMLEQQGGVVKLQTIIHPMFLDKYTNQDVEKVNFIDELRTFRPRIEKAGNALSADVMHTMERKKTSIIRPDDVEDMANEALEHENQRKDASKVRLALEIGPTKPRMSKRARRKLEDGGQENFAGWQVKVDGKDVDKTKASKPTPSSSSDNIFESKKYRENDFFLSVEQDVYQKSKEQGLEMEKFKIDLVADDSTDLKKQKAVMRWDARKKKYLPVMLSADGRVNRKLTRKNEAGKKVNGEAEKSDLYAKWSRSSKARIQKVGELEVSNAGLLHLKSRNAGNTTDFANSDSEADSPKAAKGKTVERKPVVPFHGHVEDKYLTNKQKRLLKKREGLDKNKVVKGAAKKEVKNATDLKKTKKTQLKHKLKTNVHMRKEHAMKSKDAFWSRHAEKIAKRAARPRSFALPEKKLKKRKNKASKQVYLK
eukprot:GEMP01009163.1.p1 GENE.GEMP01009163.1~~GEMP01009163.1.p1  ORF type:complete len:881 (+),score=205.72 GEMP01009163.1:31-2643(+)